MLPAKADGLPAKAEVVPANVEVLPDNADARPVAADFVLVNHQVRSDQSDVLVIGVIETW